MDSDWRRKNFGLPLGRGGGGGGGGILRAPAVRRGRTEDGQVRSK